MVNDLILQVMGNTEGVFVASCLLLGRILLLKVFLTFSCYYPIGINHTVSWYFTMSEIKFR